MIRVAASSVMTLLQVSRAAFCCDLPPSQPALPVAPRLFNLQRRAAAHACALWPGYAFWAREASLPLWESPPAEGDTVPTSSAAAMALLGAATMASSVLHSLAVREGVRLLAEPAGMGTPVKLEVVVRAVIEMGYNCSISDVLTAQQVTEMWQPLAVELCGDTLLTLCSILVSLLSGERDRRGLVATISALRVLTVHLVLYKRCAMDAATILLPPPPAPGENDSTTAASRSLRSNLLERLFSVLLVNLRTVSEPLHQLWGAMQAEIVCVLIAGHQAFFPQPQTRTALFFTCLKRRGENTSTYFLKYIDSLMLWLAGQPSISSMLVPEFNPLDASMLQASLPKVLDAQTLPYREIQNKLVQMLLDEVDREARAAVKGPVPVAAAGGEVEVSVCLKLLTASMVEVLARASLSDSEHQPHNATLISLSEQILSRANELLVTIARQTQHESLQQLQLKLSGTFVANLIPWLVDALALFSAYPFEHAWRLLPASLSLLHTLRRLLSSEDVDAATGLQNSRSVVIESTHPYKSRLVSSKKGKVEKKAREIHRKQEKHEWPGATQLQIKFDRRCCTEDGDWLTLRFSKEGVALPTRTLRLGGGYGSWPKQQIQVSADTVLCDFAFASNARTDDSWGYSINVIASKRGKDGADAIPPLVQLQRSLLYLGAKFASLLVAAEPVTEAEKEQKRWLQSPLFVRGLPLQLPSDHALMNPFFGVKLADNEAEGGKLGFLNDLVRLGGGAATPLHGYMLCSTPQLCGVDWEVAELELLGTLLSHNGLLQEAMKAAAFIVKHSTAQPPMPPEPPSSPPSSPPSLPPSPPASPPSSPSPQSAQSLTSPLLWQSSLSSNAQCRGCSASSLAAISPPPSPPDRTSSARRLELGELGDVTPEELEELEALELELSFQPGEREIGTASTCDPSVAFEGDRGKVSSNVPSERREKEDEPITGSMGGEPARPTMEIALAAAEKPVPLGGAAGGVEADTVGVLAAEVAEIESALASKEEVPAPVPTATKGVALNVGLEKVTRPDMVPAARSGLSGSGQSSGGWVEGVGEAGRIDWSALRAQWIMARALFYDMMEAHARTTPTEATSSDQPESILSKIKFMVPLSVHAHHQP